MILEPNAIKDLFLAVLKRAKAKYAFRIENFCVMGNHFHIIIRPGRGECLSAIMQWILSVFAMAYNRIKHLTGHVWGERFYSKILASLRALQQAFEYIDANPVRAQVTGFRWDWRHGGLWHDRAGCRDILDGPSGWVLALAPDHSQLMLDSPKALVT